MHRVSRKHFTISCRMLPLADGRSHPAMFVRCLSRNGLLVGGSYVGADAEQRIEHGTEIGLGIAAAPTPDDSQPASMVSVATAAAWRPPAMKSFVVFELEVQEPQTQRVEPKTVVPVAQQAVVIDRATPVALPRPTSVAPSSGGPATGTAASLCPSSQLESMVAPPECFVLQKDSQICQSPLVKFFKSQMGS
ncbi:unnamed protein product [Symbiodinium natans]|uniref:FHA domain-containing protein n=1 Tax=Symbiodinium natans TaxID=878477 RepID=A0A812U4J2_9DINO|nr:unnamed protein product [Symbiodinium natans]